MSKTAYDNFICIEGCATSAGDLFIYGGLLAYFVCKAGKDKFGTNTILMLLVPLIQYVFCSIGRAEDYYYFLAHDNNFCSLFFFYSWFDWVQEISMVATGVIIQVFMLRNMKVAAVLRAESIEQENRTRAKVKKLTIAYLPLYFFLSISIYVMDILMLKERVY